MLVTGVVLLETTPDLALMSEVTAAEVLYFASDVDAGVLLWRRAKDEIVAEERARLEGDAGAGEQDAEWSLDPTNLTGLPAPGPLLVGRWA